MAKDTSAAVHRTRNSIITLQFAQAAKGGRAQGFDKVRAQASISAEKEEARGFWADIVTTALRTSKAQLASHTCLSSPSTNVLASGHRVGMRMVTRSAFIISPPQKKLGEKEGGESPRRTAVCQPRTGPMTHTP